MLPTNFSKWLNCMQAVTKKMVVRRFSSRTAFSGYQLLQLEVRLFWLLVFRKTIDKEEIPSHALIELACFGAQYSWKSKFSKYI